MFCRECGREIRDDSVFCSYCGIRVEEEAGASQTQKPPVSRPAAPDDDCIRPGMPKKHCAECGKELPGSTISDVCALCTIKRRNRELEEQRAREERERPNDNRDRYDISDEFDQSVFEQNRQNYYHEPEYRKQKRASQEDRPARGKAAKRAKQYATSPYDKPVNPRRGCALWFIIVFVVIVIVSFVINYAGEHIGSGARATPEPDMPLYEAAASPVSDPFEDFDPYEDWTDSEADSYTDMSSLDAFYDSLLRPAAEDEIYYQLFTNSMVADEVNLMRESLHNDGGYIYLDGEVSYTDSNELSYTDPFTIGMIVTEESYYMLCLEIGGDVYFDYRSDVANDGAITPEAVARGEYGPMAEGELLVDGPPYLIDALFPGQL